MKTLIEIKNEVAKENGFEDWVLVVDSMRDPQLWPEVCRRAQLECARETLQKNSIVDSKIKLVE